MIIFTIRSKSKSKKSIDYSKFFVSARFTTFHFLFTRLINPRQDFFHRVINKSLTLKKKFFNFIARYV